MPVRPFLRLFSSSPLGEICSQFVSPRGLSWVFQKAILKRGTKTVTEPVRGAVEGAADLRSSSDGPDGPATALPNRFGTDSGVWYRAISNLKVSGRHDTAMFFTCKVCETRSMKTICRKSYEKGVVVARCGGCNNLHLIADRLGWFGEPGSVEEFLAARGEEVKKRSVDTLGLTLEDLAGTKSTA